MNNRAAEPHFTIFMHVITVDFNPKILLHYSYKSIKLNDLLVVDGPAHGKTGYNFKVNSGQ